jgi:hypothetical protein
LPEAHSPSLGSGGGELFEKRTPPTPKARGPVLNAI